MGIQVEDMWFSVPTEYSRKYPNTRFSLGCFRWFRNLAV